ncbi:hypothetical protein ACTXIZ_01885 [Psychrobacter celer]|uniref:hypothetical protein n=1 Tax=Psychrobacter celer TaxID=306572 RepID=UPI003FD00643
MTNSQYNEQNEQDELQRYLEEKARQEQEQEKQKEQEPEQLSAYEACVLKESAKVRGLIAEAQKNTNEHSEDE